MSKQGVLKTKSGVQDGKPNCSGQVQETVNGVATSNNYSFTDQPMAAVALNAAVTFDTTTDGRGNTTATNVRAV